VRIHGRLIVLISALALLGVLVFPAAAQVLGPCGTATEEVAAATEQSAGQTGELVPAGLPLPGERATNFELQAVVGDEIKNVKLSDFNGKWRVLCFYPADFTFV
jgi:peroxiredoxin (alkyl hydroperoxide reductase subunit C)